MKWKKNAKKIAELTLASLQDKDKILTVSEGDLLAMPILKEKKYYTNYSLHRNYPDSDIFIFYTKQKQYLISIYLNIKENEQEEYLTLLQMYYYICHKIFIDCRLYKSFLTSDNISYHFIANIDENRIQSFINADYALEGDNLVEFSINTLIDKETMSESNTSDLELN